MPINRPYQQCKRCVLDTTATDIIFTETGCNFCDVAIQMEAERKKEQKNFFKVISDLKSNREYDVLLGLSGGVDSSMCLHYLVGMGLRVLCYSIDNGWQSDSAQENIMRLVEGVNAKMREKALEMNLPNPKGVPFFRYNIDLKKFAELQGAFMKAGVKNIEIPSDHILLASSYELAEKYGIKWIISGGNHATESIMPPSFGYQPRDLRHIKDIYRKFTGKDLTGIPVCGLFKWNWYKWMKGIKVLNLLDYYEYNRNDAVRFLEREYGYKPYGAKHEENVFTQWFQSFYLYTKFGIDKRKAHLSSLIVSGQITREEAMEELTKRPVYPTLGFEKRALGYPAHSHYDYKTDEKLFNFIGKIVKLCRF